MAMSQASSRLFFAEVQHSISEHKTSTKSHPSPLLLVRLFRAGTTMFHHHYIIQNSKVQYTSLA